MILSLDVYASHHQRTGPQLLGSCETLEKAFDLIRETGQGSYFVYSRNTGRRNVYALASDGVVYKALGQSLDPS